MSADDLIYFPDTKPGFRRRRCGRGFTYIGQDGAILRDANIRARLKSLAVPPAYTDVWYCPDPSGHLLATGRDAKGRKQYIYHPAWTAAQSDAKFEALVPFGKRLPRLRRRLSRDLGSDAGSRNFALAAAVTLIDKTAIRLGSPEYRVENGSYGALTLRDHHVKIDGSRIKFRYDAKGGQQVQHRMKDAKLASILQDITDVPGRTILTWVDPSGASQTLTSSGLNAYIAEAIGLEDVSAKTFRTWIGSCAAFEVACKGPASISEMATAAAERLHNTQTIARNSYIHPAIIDLADCAPPSCDPASTDGLRVAEQNLLEFLQTL
ncbi:DNA topoisomerase IB [Algirhabdus cladophorae]|uniref:DNA topoisomerase IB n=1 Tax=Algirhabdus cladophorae TaxID=3377108 RepID=UPI003B84A628